MRAAADDQQCPNKRPPSLGELLFPPPPLLQSSISMGLGRRLRAGDAWRSGPASTADVASPPVEADTASHTGDPASVPPPEPPLRADVAPPYGELEPASLTGVSGDMRFPQAPPSADLAAPCVGSAANMAPAQPRADDSDEWRSDSEPGPELQPLEHFSIDDEHFSIGDEHFSIDDERPSQSDSGPSARRLPLRDAPRASAGCAESGTSGMSGTSSVAEEGAALPGGAIMEGVWPPRWSFVVSRRLQQGEDPDVRNRRPPPPPPRICDYGDPFRMPSQGGCCQACRMAAKKYTHYKDSDLAPSTRPPHVFWS